MRYGNKFCSLILTSAICMLGANAWAASSVRILGAANNGSSSSGSSAVSKTGGATLSTKPTVAKTTRASSLRFSPTVSGTTTAVSKSTGASNIAVNPSARLSIGKYLNVGTNKAGVGTLSGVATVGTKSDINDLHDELDGVQGKIDALSDGKQAALVLPNGSFLDIGGADNNEISIDIEALRDDLRRTLHTESDLLIELDENDVLKWCYSNPASPEQCLPNHEKQVVVDLGAVLDEYDMANNASLKKVVLGDVLAGTDGILTEEPNGLIAINKNTGEIGIKYDDLQSRLGISSLKGASEMRVKDGVLQWRYETDFEADGVTKKWTTVSDLTTLLDGYMQTAEFNEFKTDEFTPLSNDHAELKSAYNAFKDAITQTVNGKQLKLTPAASGLISLTETGVIDVKMDALREALGIDSSIDAVRVAEMRVQDGALQWHYIDEGDIWHTLDLSSLYVTKDHLTTNYYNKDDVNNLAEDIENGINETLAKLALPENGPVDSGIYMLSVEGEGDDKVSTWTSVHVVGSDGELLY